jgi:hypothetical protein
VLKKTITYKNFNDEEVSEDFYFHLSQSDLVELEMSHSGGLSTSMQRIIAAEDNDSLIKEFKIIILKAYGKRSDDGRRFIKNQALREEFESTGAYSALFMELITNTDAAIEFTNGVIPTGMAEEAAKLAGIDPKATPLIVVETEPDDNKAGIPTITKAEVAAMSQEELQKLGVRLGAGEAKLGE